MGPLRPAVLSSGGAVALRTCDNAVAYSASEVGLVGGGGLRTAAVAVLLAALAGAGLADAPRTVAIAPFWDLSADGRVVDAERLNVALSALLARSGRFQVVPPERVLASMRSLGYSAAGLFHPARARQVAQALGCDWLVVGRWTHLDLLGPADETDVPFPRRGGGPAVAVLEVHVYTPTGSRPHFGGVFDATVPAAGGASGLRQAALAALRKVAAALARL